MSGRYAFAIGILIAFAFAGARPAAAAKRANPAKPARSARAEPRNPPVLLYHVNRKDKLMLRLRDASGRPVKGIDRRFERFVRCHYTGKQYRMHPRLPRLIYQIARHWPGQRVEVVSGYRHPKFAKNPRSPHMKGLACDFRIAGVKNADLRDYLRKTFKKIGVGYYPNSSFIHLDIRTGASAFWIDYSGPGEQAEYSESPVADLASGKAETHRPAKIDPSWAEDPAQPHDSAEPPARAKAPSPPE